jgi:hypothetical protein
MVLADMARAGISPPADGDFLGTRLEGGARIVVYRVGADVVELRVPVFNLGVAARRRAFHVVK